MSRTCCDGRCARAGGTCPAFAPGVIDAPHTNRRRELAWRWGKRVGMALYVGGMLLGGVFGEHPALAVLGTCVVLGVAWAWGRK